MMVVFIPTFEVERVVCPLGQFQAEQFLIKMARLPQVARK
jgi:hypothetical protein